MNYCGTAINNVLSFIEGVMGKFLSKSYGWSFKKMIIIGIISRLLLMPFVAHPFDMYSWYLESAKVLKDGFNFNWVSSSQRPIWFLTLIPIAYFYDFLSTRIGVSATPIEALPTQMNPQFGVMYVPDPLFTFLVKVPMLLADVAEAFLLYKMVGQFSDERAAEKIAFLYFFNPMSIWISAGWGQYESILVFFATLSLYYLLKNRIILSSLSLLVAVLYKFYPIVLLIPTAIYLIKRGNKIAVMKYFLAFFTPISMFLVVSGKVAEGYIQFILGFFPTNTLGLFGFGLTYWSISALFPLDPNIWAPISVAVTVTITSLSISFCYKAKFNDSLRDLLITAYLMISAFYLSYRYVGETRFILLLPFLVLMLTKDLISEKKYLMLSFVAFLYAQKNFPYYLLPIATLNKNLLIPLFKIADPFAVVNQSSLMPSLIGGSILAVLGIAFSFLLTDVYINMVRILKTKFQTISEADSNST